MWGQMVYVCVCLYVCELETSKISLLHASNPPQESLVITFVCLLSQSTTQAGSLAHHCMPSLCRDLAPHSHSVRLLGRVKQNDMPKWRELAYFTHRGGPKSLGRSSRSQY